MALTSGSLSIGIIMTPAIRKNIRRRDRRRGNAALEFALVGIAFLGLMFAQFDFIFPLFVKATLNFAVRQGARYAITGQKNTENWEKFPFKTLKNI